MSSALKSYVVYRFVCPGCNARYIGETTRHLTTRIKEHFSSKSSHIYQHLNKYPSCKTNCDENCFKVIDEARTEFSLKLKEAMYIEWEKPNLNIQLKNVQLTINV